MIDLDLLQMIARDYGDKRVKELMEENKLYGAIIVCLAYPVSENTVTILLKRCSEDRKIEIWGHKERHRINIGTLGRDTMEKLLRIVLEQKDVGKTYKVTIEKRQTKAI